MSFFKTEESLPDIERLFASPVVNQLIVFSDTNFIVSGDVEGLKEP